MCGGHVQVFQVSLNAQSFVALAALYGAYQVNLLFLKFLNSWSSEALEGQWPFLCGVIELPQ